MILPDAHRHGAALAGTVAVRSVSLCREMPPGSGACCVGLHPWHLEESGFDSSLEQLALALRNRCGSGIVAVGECGLDRVCDVPWALQLRAFEAQLALAREHGLPVVLHVVKAYPEILQARRGAPTPWFVHGFRGSPELALDLWRHGIRLSFGPALLSSPKLQVAFRALPPEAILLESDEGEVDMPTLYARAAALRGLEVPELAQQVRDNLLSCGIKLS